MTTENCPHYNTVNPFVIIKGGATSFIEFVETVFDGKENKAIRTPNRDGSLIHAEIQIGDAMILLADSKEDWPFTPAFLQVYVSDATTTLRKAEAEGATIITPLSDFYGGVKLARIKDPFHNIWWVYERVIQSEPRPSSNSNTDWHQSKPSGIYTTLMDAMANLSSPQ